MYDHLQREATTRPRMYRLCYVLGPSGSGKTFFALQHLRHFLGNDPGLPSVSLYIRPAEFSEQVNMARWEDAPREIVRMVRQRLEERIRGALRRDWDSTTRRPLEMHLSLIFDEAGNTSLRGFFDDRRRMTRLMDELKLARLADSFAVVVAGTGVQGRTLDSANEIHVVHMRPWIRNDLVAILDKNQRRLRGGPNNQDSTRPIAEAICAIPFLKALTSNGRTTNYLIEAIVLIVSDQCQSFEDENVWLLQLSERRSTIVESVVWRYASSNGLSALDLSQRRRVGAWVLGALSRLHMDDATSIELDGLSAGERSRAALVCQEVIVKSETELGLGPKQRFSASVTPALAIVLFELVGVLSFVLAGLNGGAEDVAVLYAARHWVLRCWADHAGKMNRLQNRYDPHRDRKSLVDFESGLGTLRPRYELERAALEATFGSSLRQLRLFRLQRPILSPETSSVRIPMAPKDSILVHAEKAKFADVIAPYMLIQAKYSTTPRTIMKVDLQAELRKCSLLHDCDDTRALRGLLAVWQGTLPANSEDDAIEHGHELEPAQLGDDTLDSKQPWWKQQSEAYPENLIAYSEPFYGVSYLRIPVNTKLELPALPALPGERKIKFLLSTNVRSINATLSDSEYVLLTEDSLNEFHEVDETKMSNPAPWRKFLETVRESVSVRFLFTRSD